MHPFLANELMTAQHQRLVREGALTYRVARVPRPLRPHGPRWVPWRRPRPLLTDLTRSGRGVSEASGPA